MNKLSHRFVELMPGVLDEGVLYVSIAYGTVVHRCCCGCGREVVTPLTPTDWKLIFDGETVSLYPSIGNWNFPCRSHYWIRHNRVEWAEGWSDWRIDAATVNEQVQKTKYFGTKIEKGPDETPKNAASPENVWAYLWLSWISDK